MEEAGDRVGLTRRQKEIAGAVVAGKQDRAIADEFCISFPTVRTHLQTIYEKFGVSSRTQLARSMTLAAKDQQY